MGGKFMNGGLFDVQEIILHNLRRVVGILLMNSSGHARPAKSKQPNETSDFWHLLPIQPQKNQPLRVYQDH